MSNPLDTISQAFGTLTGMDQLPRESAVEIDAEEDYLTARKNIKELVQTGMEILPDMIAVMTATQDPKMYQAAAAVLKNVASLNDTLMKVSSTREKNTRPVKSEDSGKPAPTVHTSGPVYIGTTSEILKQRRIDKQKSEAIDVVPVQIKDPEPQELSSDQSQAVN